MAPEETRQPGPRDYGTPATEPADYPGFQPPRPHELPSGAMFWLKKPEVVKMLQQGLLPNPLMQVVNEALTERDDAEVDALAEEQGITAIEVRANIAAEKIKEQQEKPGPPDSTLPDALFDFSDAVVFASIFKPPVELEPPLEGSPLTESGALSFYAISDEDKLYIMQWANSGMTGPGIARFPAEQGRPDSGSNSRKVRAKAQRPARAAA